MIAKAVRAGFQLVTHRALPPPVGVQGPGHQVQALERGLLIGREVPAGPNGPPVPGVQVGIQGRHCGRVSGILAFRAPLRTTRSTRWPRSSPRPATSAAQGSSTRRASCSSSRRWRCGPARQRPRPGRRRRELCLASRHRGTGSPRHRDGPRSGPTRPVRCPARSPDVPRPASPPPAAHQAPRPAHPSRHRPRAGAPVRVTARPPRPGRGSRSPWRGLGPASIPVLVRPVPAAAPPARPVSGPAAPAPIRP